MPIAAQLEWREVNLNHFWTVYSVGLLLVLKALPCLLVPGLLWLAVWAGLAVLLAGETTILVSLLLLRGG